MKTGRPGLSPTILAAAAVILTVGGIALATHGPNPPAPSVDVVNDTMGTVTISLCGSAPQIAAPGQVLTFDPNRNQPQAACLIHEGSGEQASGCLYVPTDRAVTQPFRVSAMMRGAPEKACGH
jgi:hypothetical protein